MRLGTSSPLKHNSPEEWASNQVKLGCGAVVFPVQSNEPESTIVAYKEAAEKAGLMIAEVGIWRNALSSDSKERKANMDVINMINSADRYFHPEEFIDECADILGSRIKSCHIKDVYLDEHYTLRLEECGPGDGEFPIEYYVKKMHEIDEDMPMILEHLNKDEDYIRFMGYLKEELNGLYKTV